MRLNMTQQGGLADEFMSGGGSVINPLFLAADPAVPLGASTKQYVDNSAASLNANNLITGTIGAARFPAMNGDLTSSAGSTTLTLSNTGVTPGAYPKVSIDNKGRVLNGLNLVESDLPTMSWNKITSDKPTTIDGYGITNAIKSTGGTMVGVVSVNGTPTQSTQLVNKSYLDTVVGGTTGIAVGDIISKIDPSTPVGFLKCNGAELVKTSYQDLYNAIGDRYTTLTKPGNGKPWQNQYDINTENLGDLMSGRSAGTLPGTLGGAAVFVTKNRIYVYGGYNGSTYLGIGYTAAINNDGTLGPWSAAATLPSVYCYSTAVVTKNKVYLIGGYLNGSTATNAIFVADINADGTIGTWGNGPNLPATVSYSHAFINVNKLYVVGGYNGSPLNSLYSAEIKDDGSLTNWSTETNLPITVYQSTLLVIKNKVYLIGGYQNSAASNVIYSAVLNSDGSIGTWTIDSYLPITFVLHQGIVTRNVIYIFGGYQNGAVSANIYKAEIRQDGSIGGWQLQTWTLSAPVSYTNVAIVKSKVYILGGYNGSAWNGNCYVSDITGGLNDYSSFYSNVVETNFMVAGSGKPWQQQYQINTTQSTDITGWVTDSSVLPEALSSAQVIVTKNRVYLLGGHNGTAAVPTVYSASINSDGTLGTWKLVGTSYQNAALSGNGNITIPQGVTNVTIKGKGSDGSTGQTSWTNPYFYYLWGSAANGYSAQALTIYGSTPPSTVSVTGSIGDLYTATLQSYDTDYAVYIFLASGTQVYVRYSRVAATITTGPSTTITVDGTVYTFPGGNGGVATQTTQNVTLSGSSSVSASYSIASGGTGEISYSFGIPLPGKLYYSQVIVTKNRVYLLGGNNGTTAISTVYTAVINADGTLGTWTTGTALPGALAQSQAILTKNRVYLLGGHNGTSIIPTVYTAPINSDGTLGVWTTGTSLPGVLANSQAIITKNRVYLLGGSNSGGHVATIYTAFINSDGTLNTWVSNGVLPSVLVYSQAIVTKNRVYLLGGYNGSGVYVSTVCTAPINADGTLGTWTTGTSIPGPLAVSQAIVTSNHIYLLGGNNSSITSNIYSVAISGGENDYTSYYDGSVVPLEPVNASTLFKLPDSSFTNDNLNYFIKY